MVCLSSLDIRRTRLSTVGDKSISCCSYSSVQQSSIAHHWCSSLYLLLSSKTTPLLAFLSRFLTLLSLVQCPRAVVTGHFGHCNCCISVVTFNIFILRCVSRSASRTAICPVSQSASHSRTLSLSTLRAKFKVLLLLNKWKTGNVVTNKRPIER